MAEKAPFHGREHSPGGADQLKSWGADDGDVLTADGAGGISWAPVAASTGSGIHFGTNVGSASGGYLDIQTNDTDGSGGDWGFKLDVVTGNLQIRCENGYIDMQTGANGQNITLSVGASAKLEMSVDNTAGSYFIVSALGTPVFEVRGDGTVHGRSAVGAITWDL